MTTTEKKIAVFKIERGGRFFAPGHYRFLGFGPIDNFLDVDDLFIENCDDEGNYPPEANWLDGSGHNTGLKVNNSGVGRLDLDGDSDSIYADYLENLDDNLLWKIYNSGDFEKNELKEYFGSQFMREFFGEDDDEDDDAF